METCLYGLLFAFGLVMLVEYIRSKVEPPPYRSKTLDDIYYEIRDREDQD